MSCESNRCRMADRPRTDGMVYSTTSTSVLRREDDASAPPVPPTPRRVPCCVRAKPAPHGRVTKSAIVSPDRFGAAPVDHCGRRFTCPCTRPQPPGRRHAPPRSRSASRRSFRAIFAAMWMQSAGFAPTPIACRPNRQARCGTSPTSSWEAASACAMPRSSSGSRISGSRSWSGPSRRVWLGHAGRRTIQPRR